MSKLQQVIGKEYKKYKWGSKTIKNDCTGRSNKIAFHKSQKFLKSFLTPKNNTKGMLLYHTVGAGKTCAAVSIASGFDQEYQVLWVTQGKLRNVVYKNIFDQVCHAGVLNSEKPLTGNRQQQKAAFRKLTKGNWYNPMTYRQFSNMLKQKNNDGKRLFKKSPRDPLRKTLVIVDEAHNLFDPQFPSAQRADLNIIEKKVFESYKKSGNNSVKVLLLSATPLSNDIMSFVRMMNIFQHQKSKRVSLDLEKFYSKYLKDDMSGLNHNGNKLFRTVIGKNVSHLDISKDQNIFAQPRFFKQDIKLTHTIDLSALSAELIKLKEEKKLIGKSCSITDLNKQIKKLKTPQFDRLPTGIKIMMIHKNFPSISGSALKQVFPKITDEKKTCNRLPTKAAKDACKNKISADVKAAKALIKSQNKEASKECKNKYKQHYKDEIKRVDNEIKQAQNSQEAQIKKCKVNKRGGRSTFTDDLTLRCMQKVSLWGKNERIPRNLQFEHTNFDANALSSTIDTQAPKMAKLFENITEQDARDQSKYGRKFKHIIYVNNNGVSGAKMVIGAMISKGFNFIMDHVTQQVTWRGRQINRTTLSMPDNFPTSQMNFSALTTGSLYNGNINKALISSIQGKFNQRPNNVNGQNIRFLIFDKNFKEGIDLYDVKYLHVLDPYLFDTEKIQLYGRGLRTCGQKGLRFVPNKGWQLKVILYNSNINDESVETQIIKKKMDVARISEKQVKTRKIMDKAVKENAIDALLTKKGKNKIAKVLIQSKAFR